MGAVVAKMTSHASYVIDWEYNDIYSTIIMYMQAVSVGWHCNFGKNTIQFIIELISPY